MTAVAVLMTCHNRRETTLACLRSMLTSANSGLDLRVFLVDDGGTDQTAESVAREFPLVRIIPGNGSLYWAGGMRVAWSAAQRESGHDYYLWINDDVVLDPGVVFRSIEASRCWQLEHGQSAVFVGGLRDSTGRVVYGGVRRASRWRALYFEVAAAAMGPEPVDTCNGNFVLIPRAVAERVGGIDAVFSHALGDYDYGFRVKQAGFRLLALPGTVGTCSRNPIPDRERIVGMSLRARWRRMTSPKLYPPKAWFVYTWRHTGWLWPVFFLRPYVEVLFPHWFSRLR